MPTAHSIVEDLRSKGLEKTRKTYARHGMPEERVLGVSVADLKLIAKTIKGQQTLALELFETGYMEAMYLAGIVANGAKMTREELQSWAEGAADIPMIAEYTVPWVAVESPLGRELAVEWISSPDGRLASSGWCTYSGLAAVCPDAALDLAEIERLLRTIVVEIAGAKNKVKQAMNEFVIAVGTYVQPLFGQAKSATEKIGVVHVDVGDTACKVPVATAYIEKAEAAGRIGQKRKTIRC